MAKIFSAAELRKRTNLSGKVREVLDGIMNRIVAHADNGGNNLSIEIDRDVVDAVVRKLKANGFRAEYNACYGKVAIGWEEIGETNVTDKPATTEKADEPATEISNSPTKDECDTKRTTQTCTATEDDSKEAHDTTATEEPATTEKANDKKQTVGIMRSVVFENCTFNISIPISIPVDIHHFSVKHTRNNK